MDKIRISKLKLNKEKAKQVILYILNKVGPMSEKKLQTLLYFIDFDYYEKHWEKLMGFEYIKQ